MRILYLSTGCFDKGGISRYNRYQISALRELVGGSQVKVFSVHPPAEGDFEEPFQVDYVGKGVSASGKFFYFLQMLKAMIFWRPVIVWVGHVNLSGMAGLLSRVVGSKVVLNTYGLEVWSGLRRDASFGLRRANTVISDCHFTARYLEESGLRAPKTVPVIWDCIDLNKFRPLEPVVNSDVVQRYRLPDPVERPWILTLGRLATGAMHKGYDRLITVFAKVARQHPSAALVIAGKGNQLENLRQQANQTGFGDRIFFTGMVHENDLPALYRMGTVFSLVSDRGIGRGEGIPLTPLEAMACGVPIIVGNDDGSQEAVVNHQNGWVINPRALDEHERILLNLLNDHSGREKKAKEAVVVAAQFFSYSIFVEKHRKLLDQIMPM